MEQLPPLGTAIGDIVVPTMQIYSKLLVANGDAIRSTTKKTFQYGSHPRQALDVYYPSSLTASPSGKKQSAVLLFFYGGGLVRGEKTLPMPFFQGLTHANLGHFFADKTGYTTVVADYRLISHGAKFPSGGEDVALVVEWVKANLANDEEKDRDLFMMGNSAGGIHLSTFLFAPDFEATRASVLPGIGKSSFQLKGAVLLSVPFQFEEAAPDRTDVLKTYFGDDIPGRCPLGLLQAALAKDADPLPGVGLLVLNGTLDPDDEIMNPRRDFLQACDTPEMQKKLTVEMMEGQNHISPPYSLGTDIASEEVWGYQVAAWIESLR